MERRILFAGFGGQGILFAGRLLTYLGMLDGKNVTWMPSYGAEMRGGTSNCGVVISEGEIGSPVVSRPGCLIAMNRPSLAKFGSSVTPGGMILYDSALIQEGPERDDVTDCPVPATRLAFENGLKGLGNLILLGKFLSLSGAAPRALLRPALGLVISQKRIALLEDNLRALDFGYSLAG